jgi:hypothetical protein
MRPLGKEIFSHSARWTFPTPDLKCFLKKAGLFAIYIHVISKKPETIRRIFE